MSRLYLEPNVAELYVVNPIKVYGTNGGESVTVGNAARGVVLDQNVEQVNLQGLMSAYTFQQTGNQLRVSMNNALLLTVSVQDDANGTLVRFSDGTVMKALMSSQGAMTLGGGNVSVGASSAVTPNSTDVPFGIIVAGASSGASQGRLYLESGDSAITLNNPLNVYGSMSATDIIDIASGTTGVISDQNIEQVNLAAASSAYTFQQGGNQLKVYQGATLVATLPVQDDSNGTLVNFSDGALEAKLGSTGTMTLGHSTVPSGTPGAAGSGSSSVSLLSQAQAKSLVSNATEASLASTDVAVVGMLIGSQAKWSANSLTYSFPSIMPTDYSGDTKYSSGWSSLNALEQSAARSAFAKLAEIIPLQFTEVNGTGDFRFSVVNQTGTAGFAITPGENRAFSSGVEGDVFLATSNRADSSTASYLPGDQGFMTMIHEIGHAVGLKHPFESPVVPQGTDSYDYSVMSYTEAHNLKATFTQNGNSASVKYEWLAMPSGYALYDIAALQALYGVNSQTRTGNDEYTLSSRKGDYLCIWDAGGNDSINAATATGSCKVNLNPGTFSTVDLYSLEQQKADTLAQLGQGFSSFVNSAYSSQASNLYTGENNLSIAYGVVVENVTTGSGNDTVVDNKYNNVIMTGAGDDIIDLGAGGFDTVDGGAGMDTVRFSSINKSQIQQELQSDGSLLLLSGVCAVRLVGVELVSCADGALTLLA